jgi:hypothetical protein
LLTQLEVTKDFPVFITETGWVHGEGENFNGRYFPADVVSDMIQEAAEGPWNNDRIVAITPFVLNYQSYPFSHFSWQKLGESSFYPQFDAYRSLEKVAGNPQLAISSPTGIPAAVSSTGTPPTQRSAQNPHFILRVRSFLSSILFRIFVARS